MRRLIERVNELPPTEPNPLKQILKAFQGKRQGKSPDTVVVSSASDLEINLVDYRVSVRSEMELALQEIDLSNLADLIRECPMERCGRLFWIGRLDKKACDRHVGLLRKRKNRRVKKETEAEAKRIEAANREEEDAWEALSGMSKTAIDVISAIMAVPERPRFFWDIDWWVAHEHRKNGEVTRSTKVVRQTINKLVKDGYLTYHESAEPKDDRYEPRNKLDIVWAAILRMREKERR